jgi:hypothetical protein
MSKPTILERTLVFSGFACFATLILTSVYFIGHMPREIHPEMGRTYAFNQHGWTVYLTYREHLFFYLLLWSSGILIVSGMSSALSRR